MATIFLIVACGEYEKKEIDRETKEPIKLIQENELVQEVNEIDNKIDKFSFQGDFNLKEDFFIRAKTVYFRRASNVKINSYNLIVEAEKIIFEDQSSLFAFYEREYNKCKKTGLDAGSVELIANSIEGKPSIDLSGQNAGQIGNYFANDAGFPVHPSHEKFKSGRYYWFNGCPTYLRQYPKDVPDFLKHKLGGSPGSLKLNVVDDYNFTPTLSLRVSHSSYKAIIEGWIENVGWKSYVPRGPDGLPTKVCYFVLGEYLCK